MALVNKTIRMTEFEWDWIAREAQEQGVSVSDYLRIAGVFRASVDRVRRDPEFLEHVTDGYERAGRALRDYVISEERTWR